MDDVTHTIIALSCIAISYYIGRRQGMADGYGAGLIYGAESAIDKLMTMLSREYGLNISLDEDEQ